LGDTSCDYDCPAYSYRRPHRKCYNNFDDCACKNGYYKSKTEDKCMKSKVPVKMCDYKCPEYAKRKKTVSCYEGFKDCECYEGYYKSKYEGKYVEN
jgi:hypothetical protein